MILDPPRKPQMRSELKPPSVEEIREASERDWNKCACIFQAEIVHFLLQQPKHNLVATAATGMGKMYTFFLPAWYEEGITFIIVPLKNLESSTVKVPYV